MNKVFLIALANLLEEHKVTLASPNDCEEKNKVFSHIEFRDGTNNMYPLLERCVVSAYDLRCEAGMSSKEANELHQLNKRIKSI